MFEFVCVVECRYRNCKKKKEKDFKWCKLHCLEKLQQTTLNFDNYAQEENDVVDDYDYEDDFINDEAEEELLPKKKKKKKRVIIDLDDDKKTCKVTGCLAKIDEFSTVCISCFKYHEKHPDMVRYSSLRYEKREEDYYIIYPETITKKYWNDICSLVELLQVDANDFLDNVFPEKEDFVCKTDHCLRRVDCSDNTNFCYWCWQCADEISKDWNLSKEEQLEGFILTPNLFICKVVGADDEGYLFNTRKDDSCSDLLNFCKAMRCAARMELIWHDNILKVKPELFCSTQGCRRVKEYDDYCYVCSPHINDTTLESLFLEDDMLLVKYNSSNDKIYWNCKYVRKFDRLLPLYLKYCKVYDIGYKKEIKEVMEKEGYSYISPGESSLSPWHVHESKQGKYMIIHNYDSLKDFSPTTLRVLKKQLVDCVVKKFDFVLNVVEDLDLKYVIIPKDKIIPVEMLLTIGDKDTSHLKKCRCWFYYKQVSWRQTDIDCYHVHALNS